MMTKPGKYWDVAWNWIIGCSGCSSAGPHGERCWAARMAARFRLRSKRIESGSACIAADHIYPWAGLANKLGWTGEVRFREQALEAPLHWRRPRVIATNWMGDMCGDKVPDAWIDRVFATILLCPQHHFLILTKRPGRLAQYSERIAAGLDSGLSSAWYNLRPMPHQTWSWPPQNCWAGTSAENQQALDDRVPKLLQCGPGWRYWVSLEPLLGPVDLTGHTKENWRYVCECGGTGKRRGYIGRPPEERDDLPCLGCLGHSLSGVVLGAETGPGARPMHPDWARRVRDDCQAAGVPFYFKGWGEWAPMIGQDAACYSQTVRWTEQGWKRGETWEGINMVRMRRKIAGRLLDGKEHNEVGWAGRL